MFFVVGLRIYLCHDSFISYTKFSCKTEMAFVRYFHPITSIRALKKVIKNWLQKVIEDWEKFSALRFDYEDAIIVMDQWSVIYATKTTLNVFLNQTQVLFVQSISG